MTRVVLALLLALLGCGGDRRAVRALIQLDPQLPASCVVLELSDAEGRPLKTERLVRPVDHDTLSVAIFQGGLPRDIQLQAHAMWGSACDDPLWDNGTSESTAARFESAVGEVTLALSLPPPSLDADRDGFIAREAGGPDCDDTQVRYRPGVQELCDASDDLNCDGRRGCDDASCADRACSRVATALAFSSAQAQAAVGECSHAPLVVERRDAQGLPTAPNYATPVALSTTLPADAALYADAACGTSVTALSIPARASSLSFYVRGTRAARGEVMATSASLSPATLTHTLLPGPTTRLAFSAVSSTSLAGECVPVTLTRRDRYDNDNTGAPQSVSFSPPPSAQGALYLDSGCGSPVSSASFPDGGASLPLYFRGTRAGDITLVASLTGVDDTRHPRTVLRGPAAKLSLSLAPVVLMGSCSSQALVRTTDAFDNPVPPAAAVSATLAAVANLELYSDAACTSALSTLSLTPAAPTSGFYVKGRTSGQLDVTASSPDLAATTQAQVVAPLVRRDLCTLAPGKKSVECPIIPALSDREHAFLVFQSTTNFDTSESVFVRCRLGSTQSILCDRVGDQGTANIQWQVVELARGLRVQHLEQTCVNSSQKNLTVDIPTIVQPEKAFVLFSSSQAGTTSGSNDFATVQLSGNKQVKIDLEDNCYASSYAVQVVELDNLSVTRNVTGSTSAASMDVSVASADVSRSVLSSTFRAQGTDNVICARMVRGELLNATTLRFSRGADSTACNATPLTAIAYERLTFPPEIKIQARTLSLDANATTLVADGFTPFDPTRTLLLSSNQVHGGQGAGETAFATDDVPGMAVARLRMTSSTQLELARDASGAVSRWTVYAVQFEP